MDNGLLITVGWLRVRHWDIAKQEQMDGQRERERERERERGGGGGGGGRGGGGRARLSGLQ